MIDQEPLDYTDAIDLQVADLGAPDVEYTIPDSVTTTVHPDGTVTHENPENWTPPVSPRHTGPSPLLVRQSTKQAWSQAKPLDALKDMAGEKLQAWVDGMNEVAGFAKYKVA